MGFWRGCRLFLLFGSDLAILAHVLPPTPLPFCAPCQKFDLWAWADSRIPRCRRRRIPEVLCDRSPCLCRHENEGLLSCLIPVAYRHECRMAWYRICKPWFRFSLERSTPWRSKLHMSSLTGDLSGIQSLCGCLLPSTGSLRLSTLLGNRRASKPFGTLAACLPPTGLLRRWCRLRIRRIASTLALLVLRTLFSGTLWFRRLLFSQSLF